MSPVPSCAVPIRHEHDQIFALEAEVEIETEKNFLPRLGLRLRLKSMDPKELKQDFGVSQKKGLM